MKAWNARQIGPVLAIVAMACAPLQWRAAALDSPSAWRDHATGFAIAGYDPVAYHTHGKAIQGREGVEHRWGGAVWRFANTGNRDAFARHPDVYAPRFAGYDAEALAKGVTVQGDPTVWALRDGKVYLFRDEASLGHWRASYSQLAVEAEANWARLGGDLPGASRR